MEVKKRKIHVSMLAGEVIGPCGVKKENQKESS